MFNYLSEDIISYICLSYVLLPYLNKEIYEYCNEVSAIYKQLKDKRIQEMRKIFMEYVNIAYKIKYKLDKWTINEEYTYENTKKIVKLEPSIINKLKEDFITEEIMKIAIDNNVNFLEHTPIILNTIKKLDDEYCNKLLNIDPSKIIAFDINKQTEERWIKVVSRHSGLLSFLPNKYRNMDFYEKALISNTDCIMSIDDTFLNQSLLYKVCKSNILFLMYYPYILEMYNVKFNETEINLMIDNALDINPYLIDKIHKKYLTIQRIKQSLKKKPKYYYGINSTVLNYIKKYNIKQLDHELIELIVFNYKDGLFNIPRIYINKFLINMALKRYPNIISHMDSTYIDYDIAKHIIYNYNEGIKYISKKLITQELKDIHVLKHPLDILFISDKFSEEDISRYTRINPLCSLNLGERYIEKFVNTYMNI